MDSGENPYNSVVVLGPTATGKTSLAVHLARAFSGEVISADSRQVYRGLDIGSGKDLREYGEVPYHLVDVTDLRAEYNVFSYQRDFYRVFSDVISRGRLPVVAGGTGMYLDAVVRGYSMIEVPVNDALRTELATLDDDALRRRLLSLKSDVHNRTDLVERDRLVRAIELAEYRKEHGAMNDGLADHRPDIRPLILGTKFDRAELRIRIRRRLDERLAEGLVAEVQGLHDAGTNWERLERLGLEYRFTAEFLQGKFRDERDYADSLFRAIGQFAKRQETWFRGMERKGVEIHWIRDGSRDEAEALVHRYFRP